MGLLQDKVAFITGAARGQGRAHAVTSAREGADVILFDIAGPVATVPYPMPTADDLAETAALVEVEGRKAQVVVGDVRSQSDLDRAVDQGLQTFGKIDILIANAGIFSLGPFWELSEEQWDDMLGVNLTGVWRAAKAVTPHMIERQSGSIVIISSMSSWEPLAGATHYAAAKSGVVGLTKNIALELGPHGVRCNSISPGAIDTGMANYQGAWDMFAGHEGGTREDMLAGGYAYNALKGQTFMSPQVIANTALYLNSDLAATVTGAIIPVDAGHLLLTGYNHSPVR